MALNEKDRRMITSHTIGKAVLSKTPAINTMLNAFSDDQEVKNVLAGNVVLGFFEALFSEPATETLPVTHRKRNRAQK